MSYGRAAWSAGAVGALLGVGCMAISVTVLGAYGVALFFAAPIVCGVVSAVLFVSLHGPSRSGPYAAALCAMALAGAVLVAFAVEGFFCLLMAAPLVLLGVLFGALIGAALGVARDLDGPRGRKRTVGGALAMLPLSLLADQAGLGAGVAPAPVETEIVVAASPELVWRRLVAFPRIEPPREWFFRAGIAAPLEAILSEGKVGAVRICRFTTGDMREPIEVWDPPRALTYAVASQPDPMREMTLWRGARPPHLDGYLEATLGQFELHPLAGGRTRLVGRTWYRTNMVPERYWRLWGDAIIHAIQRRVLRHVAALAERDRLLETGG